MVWYKCNGCGFMDIRGGMEMHLAMNKKDCLDGKQFVHRNEFGKITSLGDIKQFCEVLSDEEYEQELLKLHQEHLKRESEKVKMPVKAVIIKAEDGKSYTKEGFQLGDN